MKKFEFASAGYIDELRRQLADALRSANLSGVEFTMSEEYTDPPAHLSRDGRGSIGFYIRISGGRYEVGDGPRDDADVCIVADYQSVLPFVRREHGRHPDEDPELLEARKQLAAQGKITIKGDFSLRPAVMHEANLHDRMAVRTL